MTGSIFDLERMFREKDAQFLKFKLDKFVSENQDSITAAKLKSFLEDDTVLMLKKNLSLNDLDLAEEIQLILKRHQKENLEKLSKIISCETCKTRLRICSPIQNGIYSCPSCSAEFKVFQFGADIYTVFMAPPEKEKDVNSDPYQILGVSYNSNIEEVKNAYRKKIAGCHPDKVAEMAPEIRLLAEEMAKKINLAYR